MRRREGTQDEEVRLRKRVEGTHELGRGEAQDGEEKEEQKKPSSGVSKLNRTRNPLGAFIPRAFAGELEVCLKWAR